MCGILIWIQKKNIDCKKMFHALELLEHRGPDNINLFLMNRRQESLCINNPRQCERINNSQFNIGIGHTRLAILDLGEASNQPMLTEDKNFVLSYNGEIYNYQELRDGLKNSGVKFSTESDTEVLLKLLSTYGPNCVRTLNGMWAFSLFDAKSQKILLSRDRYGVKPLFYFFDENNFIAASEMKSIFSIIGEDKRKINLDCLINFALTSSWPTYDHQNNFYRNIKSLPPGSQMTFDIRSHTISIEQNNPISDFMQPPKRVNNALLNHEISQSIKLRLRSDAPIAIPVSGGVDSSYIASVARLSSSSIPISFYTGVTQLRTRGNDLEYSRALAKNLDIDLVEVDIPENIDLIKYAKEMTLMYDIPVLLLGNSIAMNMLYGAISRDGNKVVLDGTGGDEIFGGYHDRYSEPYITSLMRDKNYKELAKFIYLSDDYDQFKAEDSVLHLARIIQENNERPFFFRPLSMNISFQTCLEDYVMEDIVHGMLPNWLYMNDINSMAHSVESRSPFLDVELAKYAKLPGVTKFKDGYNKHLLRGRLPGIVGDKIKWRRDKQGFRWSPGDYVKNNGKEIRDIIDKSILLKKLQDLKQVKDIFGPDLKITVGELTLFSLSIFGETFPDIEINANC